jgi:hypothetical protein
MFTQFKTLLPVASIFVGSVCFAPYALAGEGGIAGAASFNLNGGSVTEATAAVAIGKSTAYAAATASGGAGPLEAFAVGTGGMITFGGSIYINSVEEESTAGLQQAQTNEISNDINIDVINGKVNTTSSTTAIGGNTTSGDTVITGVQK